MSDYIAGYDDGYLNGYANGAAAMAADLDARDEQLARRIVALLLQHDYNGQLVASIGAKPINWRTYLQPDTDDNPAPHDYWPAPDPR